MSFGDHLKNVKKLIRQRIDYNSRLLSIFMKIGSCFVVGYELTGECIGSSMDWR